MNTLSVNLNEFGLNKNSILIPNSFIPLKRNENNIPYVQDGRRYEEFFGHIADLLGMNKHYLLAICYFESSNVNSKLARTQNNFGGMKYSTGSFMTFLTLEEGIIEYCMNLKGYERYNYTSLESLSSMYVNGKRRGANSPAWAAGVRRRYRDIDKIYEKIFGMPKDAEIEYVPYDSVLVPNVKTGEKEKVLVFSPYSNQVGEVTNN